jgi:hypothetical protein
MPEQTELWPHGSERAPGSPDRFWLTTDDFISALGEWAEPLTWFIPTIPTSLVNTDDFCARQPIQYPKLAANDALAAILTPWTHAELGRRFVSQAQQYKWNQY